MSHLRFLIIMAASIAMVVGVGVPAHADPTPGPDGGNSSLDALRANLASASEGYIKAEAELESSKLKQAGLQQQLTVAEAELARVRQRVAVYAAESYRTGRITALSLMLQATSTEDLIGRAETLDGVSRVDAGRLDGLAEAKARVAEAKSAIDAEVAKQSATTAEMARRKAAAQKALSNAVAAPPQIDPSGIAIARAAPRNADGTWPTESCSVDDPTTSGCITPRTLWALSEAKRAGFTQYVSCYRPGDKYEHPKGRACDFSATPSGFVNASATGDNKVYGNRLAAYFVKNAKALAVMYVVWYCQIWTYTAGWHVYRSAGSNCGDDPAGDHTNHVHVSIF